MRAKTLQKPKVNIITLGCSKNMVDSENIAGQLKANDIAVEHESRKSQHNIVVVNTCGFIEKAKAESIETILTQVALKKKGKLDKVFVTGCLSERYKSDLMKEIPEVDAWFGTMDMPALLGKLDADYKAELLGERILSTPSHYAYLKISEGCNRTCSFCAIPLMRGGHISKSIEALVGEAEKLAKSGVKELMLIAQELTYYGLDIYKKRALPELLEALVNVNGIEWIRLHYAYPSKFPLEILDAMNKHEKICKYLDMPLQHASDKVLQSMKRNITKAEMETLFEKIRMEVKDICLRTTLIVGYPGETKEDIDILKDFLTAQQFDRVGVFTYSHEENTPASLLDDNVSQEEKEERAREIMEHQQDISLKKNEEKIGKVFKTIVDRKEAGRYIGRTAQDSVEVDNEVIIQTEQSLSIGSFADVLITKAYDYDIEGELYIG